MKSLDFSRHALGITVGICAASLLADCGGSQPPIGAPGAMRQSGANREAVCCESTLAGESLVESTY